MADNEQQRRFATTHWSMILAAGRDGSPESRRALESLCETYWYPLYAFVRRQDFDHASAEDLTQAFFARLLEHDDLRDVRPEFGRFRSFLLASLKHFISNERDRERTLKRGGGKPRWSLDFANAERRYSMEPADESTAEATFDRQWALRLLSKVREGLRLEFQRSGKADHFDALAGYLTMDDASSYRETAEQIGMTEGAVKVAVHRLRRRFGSRLREEIAQTVATEDEVDDEIRDLFEALKH